ncbi:YfiR family protein [Limibacter armeniacum]|uniref:YfiR family protein n=1 Tax=Limibacter armeniacum TaxID=466084 RepID=UPI002FE51EB8
MMGRIQMTDLEVVPNLVTINHRGIVEIKQAIFYRTLPIMVVLLLIMSMPKQANAQYAEYETKAGMIYTFGKLVTWPSKAFDSKNKLVLGVLGDDPFGSIIDNVLKNRPVNGRYWEIRRGTSIKELKGSHIIFIGNSYPRDVLKSILDDIYSKKNSMVLTIGDNIDGFCELGGIINLTTNLYQLNVTAANNAQLTVDVKLLNLASDIVPYDNN